MTRRPPIRVFQHILRIFRTFSILQKHLQNRRDLQNICSAHRPALIQSVIPSRLLLFAHFLHDTNQKRHLSSLSDSSSSFVINVSPQLRLFFGEWMKPLPSSSSSSAPRAKFLSVNPWEKRKLRILHVITFLLALWELVAEADRNVEIRRQKEESSMDQMHFLFRREEDVGFLVYWWSLGCALWWSKCALLRIEQWSAFCS